MTVKGYVVRVTLNGVKSLGSFANDKTEGVMQMLLYDDLCRETAELIQQIEEMGASLWHR